jgi:hypothetical protein
MSWLDTWKPLSKQLQAWLAAAKALLERDQEFDDVTWKKIISNVFLPEAKRIWQGFELIARADDLPQPSREALVGMLDVLRERFQNQNDRFGVRVFASFLPVLAAPLEVAAASSETWQRNVTERAFAHLNRSLVVDDTLRARWLRAFAENEPECEKLGAVHLLQHGIFAFKAHGKAGRTDIILGGPLDITSAIRASNVLALTEWKLVQEGASESAIDRISSGAIRQMQEYTAGVLGGIELVSVRFVVLVSKEPLPSLADFEDGGFIYRHINVAIRRDVPSTESTRPGARHRGPGRRRGRAPRAGQ